MLAVTFDEQTVNEQVILAAVNEAGYTAVLQS